MDDPSANDVVIEEERPAKRGRKPNNRYAKHYTTGKYCLKSKRSEHTCNHCGTDIGATKALNPYLDNHIVNECKLISPSDRQDFNAKLASYQSEPIAPTANRSQLSVESKTKTQSAIHSHFNSPYHSVKLGADIQSEYNTKQLRWAIACNIPFSAFDNPFFLSWMNSVHPKYLTACKCQWPSSSM
jgi:hypothetical protein